MNEAYKPKTSDWISKAIDSLQSPPSSVTKAVQASDGTRLDAGRSGPIGFLDGFKLAQMERKENARLRAAAARLDTELQLQALDRRYNELSAYIDIEGNERWAALAPRLMASQGTVMRQLKALRHELQRELGKDRKKIIDAYVEDYAQGLYTDQERDSLIAGVLEDFREIFNRLKDAADRLLGVALNTLELPANPPHKLKE